MSPAELLIAVRSLVKRAALTVVLMTSLVLGIGANVAVFSVAKAVLLEPLPFEKPEGLFMVWERNFPRDRPRNVVSPANFVHWRESSRVFSAMLAMAPRRITFASSGFPEIVPALESTEGLFEMLGVAPLMGRTFSSEEYRAAAPVAVITHRMWLSRLGGDPRVVGRALTLEEQTVTVVGVMPRRFRFEIPGTSLDPTFFLS